MRFPIWLGLAGLATLATGCGQYLIYQASRSGQIYVVHKQFMHDDVVYSCDATNSTPICYRTQEIELP